MVVCVHSFHMHWEGYIFVLNTLILHFFRRDGKLLIGLFCLALDALVNDWDHRRTFWRVKICKRLKFGIFDRDLWPICIYPSWNTRSIHAVWTQWSKYWHSAIHRIIIGNERCVSFFIGLKLMADRSFSTIQIYWCCIRIAIRRWRWHYNDGNFKEIFLFNFDFFRILIYVSVHIFIYTI